jgi:hypothetical protein
VSLALNCTECSGRGWTCFGQGREVQCQPDESRCGREWLVHNHTYMYHEGCVKDGLCVGSIDCNTNGFKLGKRYKNGTKCVVTCCDGDNCNHTFPFNCFNCQGKGEKCYKNSKVCAYGEDRCLRINFKIDGVLMTEQRCYQSSRCSNTSEICDLVKNDHPNATECKHVCCERHHCDHRTATKRPSSPSSSPNCSLPSFCFSLIAFLLLVSLTAMANK